MPQTDQNIRSYPLQSLKGEKNFRRVRRLGVGVRKPLFTLRAIDYRPRHGAAWRPAAQIGIVVPKKVLKNATDRNRVRRRVREALRTLPNSPQAQPLPACRAVLFPNADVLRTPFALLQAEIAGALKQLPSKMERAKVKKGRDQGTSKQSTFKQGTSKQSYSKQSNQQPNSGQKTAATPKQAPND